MNGETGADEVLPARLRIKREIVKVQAPQDAPLLEQVGAGGDVFEFQPETLTIIYNWSDEEGWLATNTVVRGHRRHESGSERRQRVSEVYFPLERLLEAPEWVRYAVVDNIPDW